MITEEFELLKNAFLRIKKLGYVKVNKGGLTRVEKTFKDLLKREDISKNYLKGIEIKEKRGCSRNYVKIFVDTPKGRSEQELKRLKNLYGTTSLVLKNKILNVSVQANSSTLVATRFLFKLDIDKNEKKIYLIVYDKYMTLLEKRVYWDFLDLKRKLEKEITYLALLKAWPQYVKGIEYCKFYDMEFYKLKSFDNFLNLVEEGTIRVTFKVDVFKKGCNAGEINDKGTSFEIQEIDLVRLFELIKL